MTEPNTHTPTDKENEKALTFLKNEIADLKSRLTKKDDRIASLDVMLNSVMETLTAERRAFEDLEDKMDDVVEKLRERVPHSDILDFLKVKDRNQVW